MIQRKWSRLLPSPPFLLACASILGLILFEQLFLPFRVHDFLEVLPVGASTIVSGISILLAILLIWVGFTGGVGVRAVVLFVFLLSAITEYSYVYVMGRFSIIQDYEIGMTAVNPELIGNAILSYRQSLLASLGVSAALLAGMIFTRRMRKPGGWRRLSAVLALTLAFYVGLSSFCRGTFTTVSAAAGLRTLTFTSLKLLTSYNGPRISLPRELTTTPQNNIIFVVDESIRCDRLSLNGYDRETTPYLEDLERQGMLINWGAAAASSTMSLNSNLYLLTGVTDMPDTAENTRRLPTIFHYAHAAGYRTYHFDAQMDTPWLMASRDQPAIDIWRKSKDLRDGIPLTDIDFATAQEIRAIIHASSGNFIWVNKMGVHFPYPQRYPANAAAWQPALEDLNYDFHHPQLISNAYDNAVRYNLDRFFAELIGPDGLPDNTIILYTSDHGQTLSENGERWPHAGATRNEACVPLFLVAKHPPQMDTSYPASHANIFPTLLDFMQIPADDRVYSYAQSLQTARLGDALPRRYIFGTYSSYYASKVYPFD